MNRIVVGAFVALLFMAAGLFWMQGRAEVEQGAPLPEAPPAKAPEALPSADVAGLRGPAPPEATELTREQRRFGRYDRDRDGRITRNELLATRTAAFRKLDKDGNNLLTFEEWAAATSDRFASADANHDLWLSPDEFRSTAPRPQPRPKCGC
ncbi:EF-hand domain-containing protein [Novosphingobium album (ex Liu et al. 2023)]|uniref:EF-hand domain-containing protein n=1 Tax=Novosphingobium album (ex Liu et al. 2023) TaxID=3031130 RepID=A0ABT5WVC2_9SPHN|nr:EF-hand domain-containing protein [Novosphingobium album (ex Liu et al. 2023)]MDE8653860.1 EF-hand domain-containing protein [Novosphingobium album (ex Liu et al. 2023)]